MRAALVLALALAGCGTGSAFDYAVVGPRARSCPRCGGLLAQLRTEPVDACELGAPQHVLVVTLYFPVEPRVYQMNPAVVVEFTARRCEGDDCESATGGTFEIASIAGDVYELRWSIEFLDGSRDQGSASALFCDVDIPPR